MHIASELKARFPSAAGPVGDEHVDFGDASRLLGVRESWLRKAALREGGPPSAVLGGERRFPIRLCQRWLDEQWSQPRLRGTSAAGG